MKRTGRTSPPPTAHRQLLCRTPCPGPAAHPQADRGRQLAVRTRFVGVPRPAGRVGLSGTLSGLRSRATLRSDNASHPSRGVRGKERGISCAALPDRKAILEYLVVLNRVPTPTLGARRRNCIICAYPSYTSRPEVARAKSARPEVEHQTRPEVEHRVHGGAPTPTSGARMRNCAPCACPSCTSRPEVARAKIARPEVDTRLDRRSSTECVMGSRRLRRVREGATASYVRTHCTPRDRRWREPNPLDRRSNTKRV